jgi:HlyD family secretion protein
MSEKLPNQSELTRSPLASRLLRNARQPFLIVFLLVAVGMAGVAAWSLAGDPSGIDPTLVFYTVKRADLPIKVTESGSLQSQKNTAIRCEVENVGYERDGTQILSIVPNGENVVEGALLVELDAAKIHDRLDEQVIATERSRSEQIQRDVKHENQKTQNETALAEAGLKVELDALALKQYEDEEGGTFQIDLQEIDLNIQTARATQLIQANDLKAIEALKKLGYRNKGQLAQARLAAMTADRTLARELSKRTELVDYSYNKTKLQLRGAVATSKRVLEQVKRDNVAILQQTKAAKDAADRSLLKEEEKLAKYKKQLDRCKIYAPHDGMVNYAYDRERRSTVGEGTTVRQRQRIITLPDLTLMEVKTSIHESVLDLVKEGLTATVTLEAFSDTKYTGSVKSVAVLAESGDWHSQDVKVYTTIITIDGKVERLRPGMSAIVQIHVDRLEDVLSVPVQAIVQVGKKNWCYVDVNGSVELKEVTIGKTNDKFIEIREGLEEGMRVVLNPSALVKENEDGTDISPEGDGDEENDKENAQQGMKEDDEKKQGDQPAKKTK